MIDKTKVPFTESARYFGLLAILFGAGLYVCFHFPKTIPAKLLDLRKDKSRNHYAVIFCERDAGFYGHVFITMSDYHDQRKFPVTEAYGFYSVARDSYEVVRDSTDSRIELDLQGKRAILFPVKFTLVAWIDSTKFEDCQKLLSLSFKRSKRYKLFNNDCITFVQHFEKTLGLKSPSRLLNPEPKQYIEALFELN
ncbi:hypothetical protein BDD43_2165 [Mucilaginibacter gracilis]|uniref:Uncharacterized protein n=2 Tax=Mucilaginibacter gracilis TaxID=423350 RepID=A0A495J031_9SPHI|nr:hypothetical protein BDD43_2165 [Mucilaginibacter gracilis]